jgi:hypothetical protein
MTENLRTLNRNANAFRKLPLLDRFKMTYEVADSGCWEWLGSITTRGYGQFKFGPRPQRAHRVAYILFVGPIPDGMTIVTRLENHRRWAETITHCVRGHEFTVETTYVDPTTGWRSCVTCRQLLRDGVTDDAAVSITPPPVLRGDVVDLGGYWTGA